jgi:hypothetical protein
MMGAVFEYKNYKHAMAMSASLLYKTFSGKDFNEIYKGRKFHKIISNELQSYGFRYQYGLNIDTEDFYPRGTCQGGGLYFTDENHIDNNRHIGDVIVDVTVPDDALVYIEDDKFKANKIIMKNFRDYGQYSPEKGKKMESSLKWYWLSDMEPVISGVLLVGLGWLCHFISQKRKGR